MLLCMSMFVHARWGGVTGLAGKRAVEQAGFSLVGSRPQPGHCDQGRHTSPCVTTGPGGSRLSGLRPTGLLTAPAPRGYSARPVYMGRVSCLGVWGARWWRRAACPVTRQHRTSSKGGKGKGGNPALRVLGLASGSCHSPPMAMVAGASSLGGVACTLLNFIHGCWWWWWCMEGRRI